MWLAGWLSLQVRGMTEPSYCGERSEPVVTGVAGNTRCECEKRFYGWSAVSGVEMVAGMADVDTLEQLRCERCPQVCFVAPTTRCLSVAVVLSCRPRNWPLSPKQARLRRRIRCPGCACSPQGVLCNEAGTEFYLIRFEQGVWQDFPFCQADKARLSSIGVEECRAMYGTTCPGGGWNASCKFGYSGL